MGPPPQILQQMFTDSNALKALKTDLIYVHANFIVLFIAAYNKVETDDIFVVRNNKTNHRIQDKRTESTARKPML
jgi:hypothetical protein